MKKTRRIIFSSILVMTLLLASIKGENLPSTQDAKADIATETINKATILEELTSKRSRFVKQFSMSDGSFTAVTYSMPVHYKKNGKWEEINTSLTSKDKKKYKTTSIALSINVSKKITPKSVISLKRGSSKLSWALTDKKLKTVEAKIRNPKKIEKTDVLNHSQVTYKNILKNTDITYDIFPEKIQEIITIKKKQKNDNIAFQIDCGNLKVKIKNKEVYFQTAKGITKYTRLKTTITDDNGVSTTNVKVSYNKKKKVLTLTPSKKWWNSAERKFPLEVRTSYTTSNHSRDIKVGAAYAGAPNGSFGYDKSLLLQSGKCVAFVKSSTLPEIKTANVKILAATLNITNETKLTLGASKTFDVGIHKVKESWSQKKVTYNNRPVYETVASSTTSMQKKGNYQCDVTDIVKDWYAGEKNYGVALVADNTNRTWKAKLDRNPSISIRYEIVGFDGAAELKEGEILTRDVLTSGQENYYYFDPEPGVAYELYSEGR
ncbi:MAG: DNRLRE domain-containing protein [Clostridiales bacterium]|nr:DNRLRE domain-containing protein [Clostridiales bacterium]